MRLVKFQSPDGPLYINPEHVIVVKKGIQATRIETVAGHHTVREDPDEVARMLGAEDIAIDVTPQIEWAKK